MELLDKLEFIRSNCKERKTVGLDDCYVDQFIKQDKRLVEVVDQAYVNYILLQKKYSSIMQLEESRQITEVQKRFVNFYNKETINPYISLAANGPWIITTCGAVLHDSGGYGMLGFGHNPEFSKKVFKDSSYVMANIMTANFVQKEFSDLLFKELGHTRLGTKKEIFTRVVCLNSGSESVSLALRLADLQTSLQINKKKITKNKKIKFIALEKGFHGRTDCPAQVSDSCLGVYKKYLASFSSRNNLITVKPNHVEGLQQAFRQAEEENVYIPAMLMEPVLGEGSPGLAITPDFYQLARKLTNEYESLLIIDSIQAGIRAYGCLSIIDYPGFQDYAAPDIETYSKAINAGQYPLSVVAMNEKVAELYKTGVYGNTMTSNPRALAVACSVLRSLTPDLRDNIRSRGQEFLQKGQELATDFPHIVSFVQGTGLLFAIEVHPAFMSVIGEDGLEQRLRQCGLGVIHGGVNALRFTPPFDISSEEIELIFSIIRNVFSKL